MVTMIKTDPLDGLRVVEINDVDLSSSRKEEVRVLELLINDI